MFDGSEKTINESDKVWMWVHQKHVMSSIIQKFHSMKTTALILLLLIMFGWIDKTMMESDELWMRVDQKYEMSRIVQKLWYGYGKFGGIWF